MIRSLWTSASAIAAQQVAVDMISSNISNVSTTGYKKGVTQFQDLFYQRANTLGAFVSESEGPTGISVGTGVRLSATQKLFDQGKLEQSNNPFDLAIDGEGFFQVVLADGSLAYTRDGALVLDVNRELMTSHGYKLKPSVKIPEGATGVTITSDGKIRAMLPGSDKITDIGSISLFEVENPNGLQAIGENLFIPSVASGSIAEATPGEDGVGVIIQGFVEGSNVELADEMTQLVIAQRAYQLNARALRTSDEMMAIATAIRG